MHFKHNFQFYAMIHGCLKRQKFRQSIISINIHYFDYGDERERRAKAIEMYAFAHFSNLRSLVWAWIACVGNRSIGRGQVSIHDPGVFVAIEVESQYSMRDTIKSVWVLDLQWNEMKYSTA